MISERQKELLKLIVEDYIKSAKPVSSNSLCEILKCSSATIRSEMSFLEDVGLLEKTHTSSGRVPSEKGYRYYVDNIMVPKELNGDDILKLQTIFTNNSLVLSDSITKSLELVSELTDLTIVSLGKASKDNCISKVEVIPLSENNLVAIIVTDRGHVENRNVILNEKVSMLEIKQTVDIINKHIVGTPLDEVNAKLEFEVKPIIGESTEYQKKLFDAFCSFFNDVTADKNVKVAGRTNLLKNFDNVDKVKTILSKIDDGNFIENIKEDSNGINIYIGSESEFDEDVSVIKAKYTVNGEEGTLAIVGPKRMEYDKATALLKYIVDNLDETN